LKINCVRAIRLKQYSYRTEETYVGGIGVMFSGMANDTRLRWGGGGGSLSDASGREPGLAAVSQNQALNALLFLYGEVLKIELEGINAKRAKHQKRLPVVLTSGEVAELMKGVRGAAGLVCKLLYGCGLRVAEALALRIKDVDLNGTKLEVRGGKGDKDRVITLPESLLQPLAEHRARVELIHQSDRAAGIPGVFLPRRHGHEASGGGGFVGVVLDVSRR